MSKARLVITAVVVEGRGVREVARDYGVSPGWVSRLVARYRDEGDTAFEPRSRRPITSPRATPADTVELVIELRRRLLEEGDHAGPGDDPLAPRTAPRRLVVGGDHRPLPAPRRVDHSAAAQASALVVCAVPGRAAPNETWQVDFTHYRLARGGDVEVLCWLDDHARYALRITAHLRVTGAIVLNEFRAAIAAHGVPASTLTDNGMVFTTRLSGGKGGRNAFEAELRRLGIRQKNSRPNHPTTCGKVERFHQTLKRWLTAQPDRPETIAELQTLLDLFATHYNHERPHGTAA